MLFAPQHPLIPQAQDMIAELRELAPHFEAERRVSAEIANRLAQAGYFRMLVPEALGGGEVHATQFVQALETLAIGDAATAWCVMTGATTGVLSAYIEPEGAKELWADHPEVIMAGIFAPMGRATQVEGGYKLSGRWPFASGCQNSHWRMGGALVMEDGAPRMLAEGVPEIRSMFFLSEDSQMHDTWTVSGMCGTGSHDISVEDVFVPSHRSVCMLEQAPRYDAPLYKFPVFGLLASGVSGVSLGIARAAIDEMIELAQTKRRPGGKGTIANQDYVQRQIAEAETQLQAGRAYLYSSLSEVWEYASKHERIGDQEKVRVRLAATFATQSATKAVDAMYHLAGGAAIYKRNNLQRHFRDIHTITQHIMVNPNLYKVAGRLMLGLPTDTSQL